MKTTEEQKRLEQLKLLNGEVRYTHASSYDGRRQSIAIVKINDKYYWGIAQLSEQDKFSRKIARVISLGRAMKNFQKKVEYKHQKTIDIFYKKKENEN